MNREDAFYYKNLLLLGFSDGYDEWLNYHLESENPMSDIVRELYFCGYDVKKSVSVLDHYCAEEPFDEAVVCNRLRLFFKEAYYSNKMSKGEITSAMYQLTLNIGNPGDFESDLWLDMYFLNDYYSLAEQRIIPWENFDFAFFSYLDNGTPVNTNLIWSKNKGTKLSILDRIKNILKKK